jgi:hypothetical protein
MNCLNRDAGITAPEITPVYSGICVTQSLGFCVVFRQMMYVFFNSNTMCVTRVTGSVTPSRALTPPPSPVSKGDCVAQS